MIVDDREYLLLLRLVDTRAAGDGFPDMLATPVRKDRLAEFGITRPAPQSKAELLRLRDALVDVVLGSGTVATRAQSVNRLVREYGIVQQLGPDLTVTYTSSRRGRVAELAARVVPQAMRMLLTGDVARVGLCASQDCAAPFVGSGAGRAREFCSPRCAGRERVRRFRAVGNGATWR